MQKRKNSSIGLGSVDPKGDLYPATLYFAQRCSDALARENGPAFEEFRRRIVICDFSSPDPVTSYNILARWPNADPEVFALNRADLLCDLLPNGDDLSLAGVGVLQKLLLLLSEFALPITWLTEVLHNPEFRGRLLANSKNRNTVAYFSRQYPGVPKSTLDAIERRMEALFASESVRIALAGETAPDFRRLQDESAIVLINCFGENIPRSVRRLLQALVLSDIRQAVFARRRKQNLYLWICDEAQNFFINEKLRDNMSDLLTMGRSFGSFFLLLTQNMSTASQDSRILKMLRTNTRWSFSMRGDPDDCLFLKPALPVTGRKVRPRISPFEERRRYSPTEERGIAFEGIANLPDRTGYLWLKTRSAEAFKVTTRELAMPQGSQLEEAVRRIRSDPTIGRRRSRNDYERMVEARDRKWLADETPGDLSTKLQQAYRAARGGNA